MKFKSLFRSRDELDLTGGDVDSNLFYLSVPIVLTLLLQTAYNLVDTFWLGRLSTEALAGITFSFPLVFLLISLGSGIAITGSVLVAQLEGSGKKDLVRYAASQSLSFSVIAGVLLGALGYLAVGWVVGLMGAESAVIPLATAYMQIISLGLVFLFTFFSFMFLMRGWGDAVTPLKLMVISVGLNMVLDPVLIFGWGLFPAMGIEGAAVATVFARAVVSLWAVYSLYTARYGLELDFRHLVPDPGFFRRIVRIGLPASLDQTSRALGVNATLFIVGMFSTPVVAGYGIGIRVLSTVFLPAAAVSQSTETMTGQNIGAGNPERAMMVPLTASKYMFLILTAMGVLTFFGSGLIASVFSSDPAVISYASEMLKFVALSFGAMGVLRAFNGGFRGAGRTALAMAVTSIGVWVFRIPLALLLAVLWGPTGIWFAIAAGNVIGALIASAVYFRYDWVSRRD